MGTHGGVAASQQVEAPPYSAMDLRDIKNRWHPGIVLLLASISQSFLSEESPSFHHPYDFPDDKPEADHHPPWLPVGIHCRPKSHRIRATQQFRDRGGHERQPSNLQRCLVLHRRTGRRSDPAHDNRRESRLVLARQTDTRSKRYSGYRQLGKEQY